MYSQQLLRVHHDEWLRAAESHRMVKQAKAERREAAQSGRRTRPQRARSGALGLRRPLRHA